jgi:hypothetical protein
MKEKECPMNANVSDTLSHFEAEQADVTMVRYVSVRNQEPPLVRSLRPIVKWFGFLSTVAWGVAALSPETLRVPVHLQGWVFVISILWFFAYCAGFFNL